MKRLTASRIGLAARCTHWLRDDAPAWDDKPGPSARLGHAIHEYAEHLGRGDIEAIARRCELRPAQLRDFRLMAEHWRRWAPTRLTDPHCEIKFAYSPLTGECKRLSSKGQRDYTEAPDGWITGTADVVQREEDGALLVLDYKSGSWVEESEHSAQLAGLSVMAAKALGGAVVRATNVKVQTAGVYELPAVERDEFLLDVEADKIREVHLSIVPDAEARPGEWCRRLYCPSRHTCPASEERSA